MIADPNALVRSLMHTAMVRGGIVVIAETPSLGQLLELCTAERPDVVVTNSDLEDGVIDDHVHFLTKDGVRLIVLTSDPSPERLTAMLDAGARGYLLREVEASSVVESVRSVAKGDIVLHPVAASTVVGQWRRLRDSTRGPKVTNPRSELTQREVDVLTAMADGLSTKGMALQLGIAVKTIESHKTRIFDKLGVRTQAHAVAVAISQGLLTVSHRAGR